MKPKVALYTSKIGVTSLHFASIYEKLDYLNNTINCILTRQTFCITQENRFKEEFYFNSCYQPNPICKGTPEGANPVTIPEEVLYGFRFTVAEKASLVIFKTHFH